MKWPAGGLDPVKCRAVDSEGRQCINDRERDGKTRFRTYCRAHRDRLKKFGDLAADVPIGRYRNEATPLRRT